jgi:hypothetical protein
MKCIKQFLSAGLLLSLNAVTVQAALLVRAGGSMVYDTGLDITWVADANLFKTQVENDANLINTVINNVGSVADSYSGSHTLTAGDFSFASYGLMNWWGAQAWAANLSYGGYSDWRLPTTPSTATYDYNQTSSELGHLFYSGLGGTAFNSITKNHNADYSLFSNVQSSVYWSGNESGSVNAPDPGYAWAFNTQNGYQNAFSLKDNQFLAWAVRSGDVATVPEPASVWLLSSGLLGIASMRRRGNIV